MWDPKKINMLQEEEVCLRKKMQEFSPFYKPYSGTEGCFSLTACTKYYTDTDLFYGFQPPDSVILSCRCELNMLNYKG